MPEPNGDPHGDLCIPNPNKCVSLDTMVQNKQLKKRKNLKGHRNIQILQSTEKQTYVKCSVKVTDGCQFSVYKRTIRGSITDILRKGPRLSGGFIWMLRRQVLALINFAEVFISKIPFLVNV